MQSAPSALTTAKSEKLTEYLALSEQGSERRQQNLPPEKELSGARKCYSVFQRFFLLRFQPARRQLDVLGTPRDALNISADTQPVELVPGELDGTLFVRQVPHLNSISQFEQAASNIAGIMMLIHNLAAQHVPDRDQQFPRNRHHRPAASQAHFQPLQFLLPIGVVHHSDICRRDHRAAQIPAPGFGDPAGGVALAAGMHPCA